MEYGILARERMCTSPRVQSGVPSLALWASKPPHSKTLRAEMHDSFALPKGRSGLCRIRIDR